MDLSSSSMSISSDLLRCDVRLWVSETLAFDAGRFVCDTELRRLNLPSCVDETDTLDLRRRWLFNGRSSEVCLSMPSLMIWKL